MILILGRPEELPITDIEKHLVELSIGREDDVHVVQTSYQPP